MAADLASSVTAMVLDRIRSEMETTAKAVPVCFTEDEAAEKLHCSPQTLAARRKAKEIDSSVSPSGRPVYMSHHLTDYLARHEIRGGRRNDVVNFPYGKRKTG